MIDRTSLLERFLRYVAVDTQSREDGDAYPSTPGQRELIQLLAEELRAMGYSGVAVGSYGYLTLYIPGVGELAQEPCVGFFAHVDTAPDAPGSPVNPRVLSAYGGGDIALGGSVVLSPQQFPELLEYRGQDLVVTDGNTLLGADDKAGVAALMEVLRWLSLNPNAPHAPVAIAFTLDEEIGRGVEHFDLSKFPAQYAYTVDGGRVGELQWECFNAARVRVVFSGVPCHPGDAKGKMRNALTMARDFDSDPLLAARPENTEGRQGFFHPYHMEGCVARAELDYIVRHHDAGVFMRMLADMERVADSLRRQYGIEAVTLEVEQQYRNMREKLEGKMWVVEHARRAMRSCGIEPIEQPIRGGTDGAVLTWRGLPCPNIFAGGMNFHSVYEYLPVESLVKAAEVVRTLACIPALGSRATNAEKQ